MKWVFVILLFKIKPTKFAFQYTTHHRDLIIYIYIFHDQKSQTTHKLFQKQKEVINSENKSIIRQCSSRCLMTKIES